MTAGEKVVWIRKVVAAWPRDDRYFDLAAILQLPPYDQGGPREHESTERFG